MDTSRAPVVVFGFLGTTLDGGSGPKRWDRWRPSVDLCRQPDLFVSRLELLIQPSERDLTLAAQVRADVAQVSPGTEVVLRELPLVDPWDFEEVFGALHDLLRSYPFEPEREDYLVHITTGTHVVQICWFLLTESRHAPARILQTRPPASRGGGDPGGYTTIDLDLSRYDRISTRFARERAEGLSFLKDGIDTRNASYNQLIERIEKVALLSERPILLTGPTGAGKSRLARRIWALKHARRKVEGELVEVNCATLRGEQAMATLFGHTRGAFTGAVQARAGLLKAANKGVLFLDEIGELGLDEQAMLLRALETGQWLPLGADRELQSRFQLIAGTNGSLREAVAHGRFRHDLLARIDLWSFELPGLAERPEDIAPNLEYELDRFTADSGRRVSFNHEAREQFLAFATSGRARWPGNFRDLHAAVARMATLSEGGRITRSEVDEEQERLRSRWAGSPQAAEAVDLTALLGPTELDRFDEVQLAEVVRICRRADSLSEAGRELFAASRARRRSVNDSDRLRKYLARFGLSWERVHGRQGIDEISSP